MSNEYYVEGDERAGKVHRLFSRIASKYDLINDVQSFGLHRLWKKKVIRLAAPREDDEAVDLCCGTGDIAFLLSRTCRLVTGLDFTQEMLDGAEERNPSEGNGRTTFQRGDALNLPFEDKSFDIVTMGYGLRNLADLDRGISEMIRVTRKGGRIVVLEFGVPDNGLWRWCYFTYLKMFVPLFGLLFCGDAAAYAYILESLKHYPAQKGVAERLEKAGCQEVEIVNLLGGVMSIHRAVVKSGT